MLHEFVYSVEVWGNSRLKGADVVNECWMFLCRSGSIHPNQVEAAEEHLPCGSSWTREADGGQTEPAGGARGKEDGEAWQGEWRHGGSDHHAAPAASPARRLHRSLCVLEKEQ